MEQTTLGKAHSVWGLLVVWDRLARDAGLDPFLEPSLRRGPHLEVPGLVLELITIQGLEIGSLH